MMEYFELFDIPVSLQVDAKAVTKKYYELSKKYHPDNFSLDHRAKQEEALTISSKINEAKKILSSAHSRLEYILKEKGVIVSDEKYQLPPSFLGEMMQINETLMELELDPDLEAKNKLGKDIKVQIDKLFEEVKPYFNAPELELNPTSSAQLKEYYYKNKYLARIEEKL